MAKNIFGNRRIKNCCECRSEWRDCIQWKETKLYSSQQVAMIATRNFCFKVREGRHDRNFSKSSLERLPLYPGFAMRIAAQERTTFSLVQLGQMTFQ